jgi:hypothetical protein
MQHLRIVPADALKETREQAGELAAVLAALPQQALLLRRELRQRI